MESLWLLAFDLERLKTKSDVLSYSEWLQWLDTGGLEELRKELESDLVAIILRPYALKTALKIIRAAISLYIARRIGQEVLLNIYGWREMPLPLRLSPILENKLWYAAQMIGSRAFKALEQARSWALADVPNTDVKDMEGAVRQAIDNNQQISDIVADNVLTYEDKITQIVDSVGLKRTSYNIYSVLDHLLTFKPEQLEELRQDNKKIVNYYLRSVLDMLMSLPETPERGKLIQKYKLLVSQLS